MAIATHTHAALTALKDALAAATGVPQSLTEIVLTHHHTPLCHDAVH